MIDRRARLALTSVLVAALLVTATGCPGSESSSVDAGPIIDAGIDAAACDPDRAPSVAPEIFIGPAELERQLATQIDGATVSIDVQIYAFTLDRIATKLIAADRRGVPVRVIFDQTQSAANANVRTNLMNNGVEVKWAPATFPYAHAKYVVVDHDTAMMMSGNITVAGMVDQRNAGLVDRDPPTVADLAAIFEADWNARPVQLTCPRLMISPADARTRVLNLIGSAATTLDIEVYYIADVGVRTAIIGAKNRGVTVRVILADASEVSDNPATATFLKNAGVQVRILSNPVPHIKLVIADRKAALIGSHNLSSSSLRDNREIGEIVRTTAAVNVLAARLDGDWNLATPW